MDDKYGLSLEIGSVISVQPALYMSIVEFFWVISVWNIITIIMME